MIKHTATAALFFALQLSPYVYAEEALDPELLFKEAMELRNSGQILDSIKVFENILNQQPGLNRARLELAIAYHQSRQFIKAKDQLNAVLNDPETPDTVKLAITGYLAQLGSDEKTATKRTSSSVYVSTGIFNDSNTNLGPSSELNGASPEKTGGGFIAMVSYSHVSRASRPVTSGDNPIDFEWHTQFSAYTKSYTSESDSDFNLQVASLSTGPALVLADDWSLQFNFKADKVFFGGDSYSFNLGLNPVLSLSLDDDLQIRIENQTTVREFDNTSDQGLDGISKMYGVGVSKLFNKQTFGIDGGLRYHSNGADRGDLNANGVEVYMGIQAATKNADSRTYLELSSREYDYTASELSVGTGPSAIVRRETELVFTMGFSHDFKAKTLKDWTINAQITHTENDSNDTNFEYDQDIFEMNLRRYF